MNENKTTKSNELPEKTNDEEGVAKKLELNVLTVKRSTNNAANVREKDGVRDVAEVKSSCRNEVGRVPAEGMEVDEPVPEPQKEWPSTPKTPSKSGGNYN